MEIGVSTTRNPHQVKIDGQGLFHKESRVYKVNNLFNEILDSTFYIMECGMWNSE